MAKMCKKQKAAAAATATGEEDATGITGGEEKGDSVDQESQIGKEEKDSNAQDVNQNPDADDEVIKNEDSSSSSDEEES